MKILKLSTLTSVLLFTGCYTQFESSDYQRQPDLTKVERKIDSNTTQTDYYDNRMYSRYFQQFGSGYSFRHYDPFYDDYGYSAYNDFYSGWNYNQYSYNQYDYLSYRMDSWYYSRFGYWPNQNYCYNQSYYGGGVSFDNNNTTTPSRRNRQGRNVAGDNVLSNTNYLPSVGSGTSNSSSSFSSTSSTSTTSSRGGRSLAPLPIILQGSSGSSSNTTYIPSNSSSGTSTNTTVVPPATSTRGGRPAETVSTPPSNSFPAPAPTPAASSNSGRSSEPAPAPARQRQGRNKGD